MSDPLSFYFKMEYTSSNQKKHGKCLKCFTTITSSSSSNYTHHLDRMHNIKLDLNKNKRRLTEISSSSLVSPARSESTSMSMNSQSNSFPPSPPLMLPRHNSFSTSSMGSETQNPLQMQLHFPKFPSADVQTFHFQMALFLSTTGLPHSILDNPMFRGVLQAYEGIKLPHSEKMPSAYQHRKRVLDMGNKIFKSSLNILKSDVLNAIPSFVTLALDGWTGQTYGAKNTNSIALCNEQSYLLWSHRNSDTSDSVDSYLYPLVKNQIQCLLSRGICVVAMTTDNASNMILLGKKLYQIPNQGRVILHISCSAHTIQLMISNIVELKPLERFIKEAENLLEAFTTVEGKKFRLELRNHQKNNYPREPLKLLFFNSTRWLSRLNSLERMVKLKDSIVSVALGGGFDLRPSLSVARDPLWWDRLERGVIPMIKKFSFVTNIVQSDSANLSDLCMAMDGFRKAVTDSNLGEILGVADSTEESFIKKAEGIIDYYVNTYIAAPDHHAYRAVSIITNSYELLSPNASRAEEKIYHTQKENTVKWLHGWGADFFSFYQNQFQRIVGNNRTSILGNIKRQLVMFEGGVHDFSDKLSDMETLTKKIPSNSFLYDPQNPDREQTDWKLFWTKYYRKCPELSILSLCLLSIGISEAACERSFSIQKLTHSDIRNRLSADIVEAEMRIRFNKKMSERIIGLNEIKREDEDDIIPEITLEIGADDEDAVAENSQASEGVVGDEETQEIHAIDGDN